MVLAGGSSRRLYQDVLAGGLQILTVGASRDASATVRDAVLAGGASRIEKVLEVRRPPSSSLTSTTLRPVHQKRFGARVVQAEQVVAERGLISGMSGEIFPRDRELKHCFCIFIRLIRSYNAHIMECSFVNSGT